MCLGNGFVRARGGGAGRDGQSWSELVVVLAGRGVAEGCRSEVEDSPVMFSIDGPCQSHCGRPGGRGGFMVASACFPPGRKVLMPYQSPPKPQPVNNPTTHQAFAGKLADGLGYAEAIGRMEEGLCAQGGVRRARKAGYERVRCGLRLRWPFTSG